MKNLSRHEGKLEIIERLPSSKNGNPRYLCKIAGFTCRTTPDSFNAYWLPNINGKQVKAVLGTHYGVCSIYSVELLEEAR